MRGRAALMCAAGMVFLPVDVSAAPSKIEIGQGWLMALEDEIHQTPGTIVEIRATDEPGAIAEIFYRNENVNHSLTDDGWYTIAWNGIEVEFKFDHNYRGSSPDLVTVFPPDGIMCKPSCEMLIEELDEATIYLIEAVVSDADDDFMVPLSPVYRTQRIVLSSSGVHGMRTEDTLPNHG